jgi:hypothetical protein
MRRDILELAHKLCIEGMTRKVTIPFNVDEDSLYECLESLTSFFVYCRETLKQFPTDSMPPYDEHHVLDPNNLYDLCFILINRLSAFLQTYSCNFRYYVEQEKTKGALDPKTGLIEIEKKYPSYSEIVTQLAEDADYYKELIMNMYKTIGGN